jgi:hypothetical protein
MSADDQGPREKRPAEDVVLVHGRTEDGKGLGVLRKRGDTLAAGEMRPMEEGKPINGEVVSLRPRGESPLLFDVDVVHAPEGARTGPAQVSTDSYREGWQSIFGAEEKARRRQRPGAASKKSLN